MSQGKKNGHGVGLSQVGTKYAASIGKTYLEILDFYYPGTEVRNNYGETVITATPPVTTTIGGETTMAITNIMFVDFLKKMVGQPYWYGTCVYKCTSSLLSSKSNQYPTHYTSSRMSKYKQQVADKKVCADCVGLGKGFMWTKGGLTVTEAIGTSNKITSKYGSNSCPDQSANGMFTYAKSKGKNWGTIDTIPEIPGLAVRKDGHVGYYIGNGQVIEAKGFNYGIVQTKLAGAKWLHWYEFPGITYVTDATPINTDEPIQAPPVDTEYEFGERTLTKGMSGSDVKELQELLMELEYNLPKYGADGKFGNETALAVREYEKDNNVKVDGIVDVDLFALLKEDQGADHPQDEIVQPGPIDVSTYPTLKKGTKEINYVTILQKKLLALGYNLGTYGEEKNGIDGDFGTKTQLAVRAFQKSKELKVDGIVGQATWTALEAAVI